MFIADLLIPIFICVVLPIAIVLIVSLRKRNSDNKRAEILIKAIESGSDFDTDRLADALRNTKPSENEIMSARLLRGCMYTLIGLALLIVFFFIPDILDDKDVTIIYFTVTAICISIGLSYLIVFFVMRKAAIKENKE